MEDEGDEEEEGGRFEDVDGDGGGCLIIELRLRLEIGKVSMVCDLGGRVIDIITYFDNYSSLVCL